MHTFAEITSILLGVVGIVAGALELCGRFAERHGEHEAKYHPNQRLDEMGMHAIARAMVDDPGGAIENLDELELQLLVMLELVATFKTSLVERREAAASEKKAGRGP